jgi:hypothetical protein
MEHKSSIDDPSTNNNSNDTEQDGVASMEVVETTVDHLNILYIFYILFT